MKKIFLLFGCILNNSIFIFIVGFSLCKVILCSPFVYHCNIKNYDINQVIPGWAKVIIKDGNEIKAVSFESDRNFILYQVPSEGVLGKCTYKIDNNYPVNVKVTCFDNKKTFFHYQINNNKIIPIESKFDYMGYSFFSILVGLVFVYFFKFIKRLYLANRFR